MLKMRCDACGQIIPSSRSVKQNAFRWEIINWLFTHDTHELTSEYAYHNWLKVKAGWVEPLMERDGKIIGWIPKRTDFKKMPQAEFNQYFNDVQEVVWRDILPKHDEAFEQEWCNLTRCFNG